MESARAPTPTPSLPNKHTGEQPADDVRLLGDADDVSGRSIPDVAADIRPVPMKVDDPRRASTYQSQLKYNLARRESMVWLGVCVCVCGFALCRLMCADVWRSHAGWASRPRRHSSHAGSKWKRGGRGIEQLVHWRTYMNHVCVQLAQSVAWQDLCVLSRSRLADPFSPAHNRPSPSTTLTTCSKRTRPRRTARIIRKRCAFFLMSLRTHRRPHTLLREPLPGKRTPPPRLCA